MKRDIAFLVLGGVSLLFSFFGTFPVDPAWLAILLCGVPILKEAAVGLGDRLHHAAGLPAGGADGGQGEGGH